MPFRRSAPTSIARHHAEWLSLLEISGPFLSMPVLLRAFPQGLDAHDPDLARDLRSAYEEWLDNQRGLHPNPALHRAWIEWVLRNVLGMPRDALRWLDDGQGARRVSDGTTEPALEVAIQEYREVLRPDVVVEEPPSALRGIPGGKSQLLVQILPATQDLEKSLRDRRWKEPPTTRMMTLLRATGIRLGLLTNGEQWMLVDAPKDGTTGYISWYAELWGDEPLTLRAFRSILGARRFFGVAEGATLEKLLEASASDQREVTDQLGYQVRRAVEVLVQAIDLADQDRDRKLLAGVSEERLYEAAITVMMRLVFLLCAEERQMLPLGDEFYNDSYAVSTLLAQLRESADQLGEEVLERRFDAWCRLLATCRAVHGGVQHDRVMLPGYGGSLFDPDRFPFLEGRDEGTRWRETPAAPIRVNNRTVLHLLEALQMLEVRVPGGGPAEARRLSFRALDIEQIGHVYEGLLDHTARRADTIVLGLAGTRDKEPEVSLEVIEAYRSKGDGTLVEFLRDQTGRSDSALRKALRVEPNVFAAARLQLALPDEALRARVLPFLALVREDSYGHPTVIAAGSVYVTAGQERRATGTHYTPRSLTEPIIQYTLEPLVYDGPAEGWPRERWRLRAAPELLDLKVCDMAMGSGAFLVQCCRYLSERVVEAWEEDAVGAKPAPPFSTSEEGSGDALPDDPDDRMTLARRLVTDRCLYGVDKNHLAVEMAKLSLWLVTLDKQRPFTFLDHALKCGDSLVGVDRDQLLRWSLVPANGEHEQATYLNEPLRRALIRAIDLRQRIRKTIVHDVRDAEQKAVWHRQAEEALDLVKLAGNLLIAVEFVSARPGSPATKERARLRSDFQMRLLVLAEAYDEVLRHPPTEVGLAPLREAYRQLQFDADALLGMVRPFHWPLEFPEAFADGRAGFAAFVGNPPFIGGGRITTMLGNAYYGFLHSGYASSHGQTDLSAFFFLRAFEHLGDGGTLGLLATKTIAEGDTRAAGLDEIIRRGGDIYRAACSVPWPGVAAVFVSIVNIRKGLHRGPKIRNGLLVPLISSFLDSGVSDTPHALEANAQKAFRGVDVNGVGFVVSPEEARSLIEEDPLNKDVLFPYLVGHDLNNAIDQSASRWVINFFDWPLEKAEKYARCIDIVRTRVYPERSRNRDRQRRTLWWRLTRPRVELLKSLASLRRVLTIAQTSRTLAFAFVPSDIVYSHATVVFAFEEAKFFSLLQSSQHVAWVLQYSTAFKGDARYFPTECFETFPFPLEAANLETIGETYHGHRRQLMLARKEGLTATYNRFHDPCERSGDIGRLRELHVEMDQAVADAYEWDDIDLGHGFYQTKQGLRFTISERASDEVLSRLLKLNHERYEEEVRAGLHEKGKRAEHTAGETAPNEEGRKRGKHGRDSGDENTTQLGLL